VEFGFLSQKLIQKMEHGSQIQERLKAIDSASLLIEQQPQENLALIVPFILSKVQE
jgi:hypothetical protein